MQCIRLQDKHYNLRAKLLKLQTNAKLLKVHFELKSTVRSYISMLPKKNDPCQTHCRGLIILLP